MQPILFESKLVLIESLWLFVSLGFIISSFFFIKLAKRNSLKLNFILDNGFKLILVSLLFSRIVYIIQNWDFFFFEYTISELQYIFYIWDKGLSFWGAILGLFIGLRYYCKKYNEELYKWLDAGIIAFFLAIFIGSIGLFLDGSSYGHETSLPWGVNFESITVRYSVPIHPTQLYSAIYSLGLFLGALWLYQKHYFKRNGDLFLGGTTVFSFLIFLEGFFRGDEAYELLGLREEQVIAFIIFLITLFLLLDRYNVIDLQKIKLPKLIKKSKHGNT